MKQVILRELKAIEEKYEVRILLAAESGSRAWGFASPDSDYDVRFIYVRSRENYLKLEKARDVIELPIRGELDINGWDLQKALRLLYSSNPALFEWFSSPVTYLETASADRFRSLLSRYFSKKKGLYHYISMAEKNERDYLKGESVKAKKYFYVLRPVLACKWILDRGTPPPVLFSELADAELPVSLRGEVDRLLDLKMNSPEVKEIPRLDALNGYLDERIAETKALVKTLPDDKPGWAALNALFLETLCQDRLG